MTGLDVLVVEPIMDRFRDVLSRGDTSPHAWTFAFQPEEIMDAAETAEVLVCSSATPSMLEAMPHLRLVHVTGTGTDRIPVNALPADVLLANTSHHGRAIAEHVMMVSLMLFRGVLRSDSDMRTGLWRNAIVDDRYPFGGMLTGKTLGVVGLGEIGSCVAELGSAMGMRVRAVRRNPAATSSRPLRLDWMGGNEDLHHLLSTSDIVVVTVPLNDSTRGLIDNAALRAMSPSAFLINVARGAVVDERALHKALVDRRIAGAGIDVWWSDPRGPGSPRPSHEDFAMLDNVVLTPHQSGHTTEVFSSRARDIATNVDALAAGHPLHNVVSRG